MMAARIAGTNEAGESTLMPTRAAVQKRNPWWMFRRYIGALRTTTGRPVAANSNNVEELSHT